MNDSEVKNINNDFDKTNMENLVDENIYPDKVKIIDND
jgi:hypothetical protein